MSKEHKIMRIFLCGLIQCKVSSEVLAQTLAGNTVNLKPLIPLLLTNCHKRSLKLFLFLFLNFCFFCPSIVKTKQNNRLLCFTGAWNNFS